MVLLLEYTECCYLPKEGFNKKMKPESEFLMGIISKRFSSQSRWVGKQNQLTLIFAFYCPTMLSVPQGEK